MKTLAPQPHVNPLDPLALDEAFDPDVRLVRDTVRDFVRARVLPEIGEWFESGTFPRELPRELGKLGVLGMHLDGYGCAGASATAYGIACRELEAGDSGLRSFVSVQGSLAMYPIHAFGSEVQKTTWLPRLASGEAIGCFGLSEWDFGSEPTGMRTTARTRGDGYVIDGTKAWITSGGIADVAIVWAHLDPEPGATAMGSDVRGFVIPTDTPGFRTCDIARKLSLRASVTSELILRECYVPASAMLPGVRGMRGPLSCLNEARYGIVWGAVGAARACYEAALAYATTRMQWGRPIAGFQLTQEKLANMALELQKAQLLATHLGVLKDAGRLVPAHVSFGKLNNVREALAIAREARTILGASGITLDYPIMRHMNNLEAVLTYEGTSEIHTLIIGQALTGLSAFA